MAWFALLEQFHPGKGKNQPPARTPAAWPKPVAHGFVYVATANHVVRSDVDDAPAGTTTV